MHDLIPLHLLRAGQIACIGQVLGVSDHTHRLRELGLRDGAEIEMVQPGKPCIIRLGGQRLCLRAEELGSVLVRPGRCS